MKHRVLCSFGDVTGVVCAGHMVVQKDTIHVDMLSGTFTPKEEHMILLNSTLKALFPSNTFHFLMSSSPLILKAIALPAMSHPDMYE